jgi:gluconolactonase
MDNMEIKDDAGQLVEGVYRIDAPGKIIRILTHEVERPNGILVSPDEKYLYVADNYNNKAGGARKLYRFGLKADGTVVPDSRKLIFDWKNARGPDGFKMDRKGRFYVAAGRNKPSAFETADEFKGGLYILSPEGELLEFVPFEKDETTNCAFGGADLKTLFVTAGGQLWKVPVNTPGRISAKR